MATGNRPAGAKPQARKKRQSAASGLDKMRVEADKVLREKAPAIAVSLGNKAAEGDLKCTELLVRFGQENEDDVSGDGAALMYSYAEQLTKELEWNANARDAGGEAADACVARETSKECGQTD